MISPGRAQKAGCITPSILSLISLLQTAVGAEHSWWIWCQLLLGLIAMKSQTLLLWTCCWPNKPNPKCAEENVWPLAGAVPVPEGRRSEGELAFHGNMSMWRVPDYYRVEITEPDSRQEQNGMWNADIMELKLEFSLYLKASSVDVLAPLNTLVWMRCSLLWKLFSLLDLRN